ncbi:MAG: energy transducer TonB [Akkermansiaceae bacterium]
MKLNSIILGIATTAVLLAVLVVTRMMVLTTTAKEFEIREIETVSLPEPPPPPAEEIPEEEVPPPPPPALADLRTTPDMTQPALPVATLKVDPTLAVDTFFSDQPPSPLPTIAKPRPKPVAKVKAPKPIRPTVKRQPPKPKSQYALGELDRKPRLLRNPSVTFPRSIRGASSGRVVVRVAILPSGRSQYVSTVSSTHAELIPLARRIANGSRFTPPTRQGKPVKAVMTWPITIKK